MAEKTISEKPVPADLPPDVTAFLNSLPVMIRVTAADGSDVWFNHCWLKFTGKSLKDEIAGQWLDAVHPGDRAAVAHAQKYPAGDRKRLQLRFRLRRHDGEFRRVTCSGTPRFGARGEFLGVLFSVVDVHDLYTDQEYDNFERLLSRMTAQLTAEKSRASEAETEAEHRRSGEREAISARVDTERQFQMLVHGITDYAVFLLDTAGHVSTWNPGAERIKGYTADEIIGRHFSLFYTEEDKAARVPQLALETAAREGRVEFENWRVRKGGERFWASVVIDAVRDSSGKLVGFAKIVRDLTGRRAAEMESQQLRLLIQGVRDYAIFLLDREGNITTWNSGAERIKGYTADEIIGRHFSVFYTEEDRAAGMAQQALDTAEREGRYEIENWRVRKDGSRFWANVVIDAIRNQAGEVLGFAKITRDLTERKQAEEELNKAREQLFQLQKMEAIGQLTGGVAHDFNNLLTIIIGNVDMAHRALMDQKQGAIEKAQRMLGNALAGAKRAASLTQRLLAFARRQPLDPKPIDVNRFVANMGEFLTRTLGEQVHVEAVTGGSLWKISADPAQLESAILNIALNARDAMAGGGKLTIEAANAHLDQSYARINPEVTPGQYVAISISDTGSGMTPDVLARVFEPFYTTKAAGQGTGLGLAQVYGFVRQSGGNVKIYSEPGEGTMVKIYLPRLSSKAAGEEISQSEEVYGASGETILVVEDDPAVLEYVTAVLTDLHYRVLTATDGPSGIKMLETERDNIDLLLTDVVMPGMSGRVLADQARRLKSDIKILFMTGYSQNAIVHEGRLDEGVHLLQKPVTPPELGNRVREVLDQPVPA
ncbi:MAG TPA: PAS domain S-box protein [Micropepsaceae bacterium]|nr:PAS domain S-box protein [Micropepsaceae bacterium]